jgi:eukaryotic-like serine/threonine-protein kinase
LDRLPAEPRVIRLLNEFSDDLSVSTTPPGAEVFLRRLGSARPERIGLTPIHRARIARGEYILSIHKQGYASFERTLSTALARSIPPNRTPWDVRFQHELRPVSKIPSGMVAVQGGEYKLRGYSRPTETAVKLSDYFIDKLEVSNREFKAFIDAGGYTNRQLWDFRFYDTQSALHGRDKTGLPGPRSWVGGVFQSGKENHPVTAVTWHEAAAYCRFQGKDLPTLFEWEKAARPSIFTPFGVIFPWGLFDPTDAGKRANFQSTGTTPVDSFEFGMSPFGVYNMAGNVAEWLRNPYDDGFTTAGGAGVTRFTVGRFTEHVRLFTATRVWGSAARKRQQIPQPATRAAWVLHPIALFSITRFRARPDSAGPRLDTRTNTPP